MSLARNTSAAVAALMLCTAGCGASKAKASAPGPVKTSSSAGSQAPPTSAPATATPPAANVTPSAAATTPASYPSALATVSAVPVRTQAPVGPADTGSFGGGVSVRISKVAAITSRGTGPGEISGAPAVALTLTLTNATAAALSLDTVAVTATYGSAATPASPDDGAPSSPFSGSVAARRTASAVYVFVIPVAQRGNVSVSISYTAAAPTVLFHGAL